MPMIQHCTYIKVDRKKIYEVLTSADGWNAWFTDDTKLDIRPDGTGEIKLRWSKFGIDERDMEDGGVILEAIPNHRFVFQWSPVKRKTVVSFKLIDYKNGTLVQLDEIGYVDTEHDIEACIDCAIGWGEALTLLKIYLEYGIVIKNDLC
ncbi:MULTISPECIES: SRPBCC family protein [Heyndrickxia]|uniref:SRPBCC family protein n=1 Tax=Heyndrickxia TaxID=2837504 RepID=UPI00217E4414|nr:SRPBCC domain-containing protein [Heyndrickxia oleronia]MCI1592146.1 SRPBCC domain-containing protein [Heyndrickxia oleronia]MCI1615111.1 SRPBCC domain-containing protein [Heyndrickxia oleronia]MCI1763102.1 SRPBCC domain-containing protein [Heyndrickxia oleronia]